MTFINLTLHENGKPLIVNSDYIVNIRMRKVVGYTLLTYPGGEFDSVVESPDEILALIEGVEPTLDVCPCPNCGRQPILDEFDDKYEVNKYKIRCPTIECRAHHTASYRTKEESIAAWGILCQTVWKTDESKETTLPEFKACPFCGGTSISLHETLGRLGVEVFYVECDACGVMTPTREFHPEAISVWNRRAS